MSLRKLTYTATRYPLKKPFKITHGTRSYSDVIEITVSEGAAMGHAMSVPYARYDESVSSVFKQLDQLAPHIEKGLTLEQLQTALPAGAARNALDCALWELQAHQHNMTLVDYLAPKLPQTPRTPRWVQTIGVGDPDTMAASALTYQHIPLLKLKCCGDGLDEARLKAVRAAVPQGDLMVDANEGWCLDTLARHLRHCEDLGVCIVEQPLPVGADHCLRGVATTVTLCADESCHTTADIAAVMGNYHMVNIKLDKTGGLTEALKLYHQAREQGLACMLGCMVAPEPAMRPARVLAPYCDVVDLDGPTFF